MDTLLDSEVRNEDIECGVKDIDNLGLTNDRSVSLSEVVDENTEEQVSRLFLGQSSGVTLDVALLSNLGYSITIHSEFRLVTTLENRIQLPMDKDISVATDGRSEVGVERDVQSVVTVLGDIEHTGTEVLSARSSLVQEDV